MTDVGDEGSLLRLYIAKHVNYLRSTLPNKFTNLHNKQVVQEKQTERL